jgi:hypothetical protein
MWRAGADVWATTVNDTEGADRWATEGFKLIRKFPNSTPN